MGISPSSLIAHAGTEQGRKQLRYAGVSAVFVPIGQGLVQALGLGLNDHTAASLVAAAIVTLPNFFANKRFVWRVTSGETLRGHVLVFWVAVMLGVALATTLTYLVETATTGQPTLVRGAAVFVAQMIGFGIVWVGRFLILDRWIFRLAGEAPEQAEATVGEIPA